jgi:hypothetical protein
VKRDLIAKDVYEYIATNTWMQQPRIGARCCELIRNEMFVVLRAAARWLLLLVPSSTTQEQ